MPEESTLKEFKDYNRINELLRSNPGLVSLANYERLCKLKDSFYVICQDYCCGEFWESSPPFCCSNNFKPLRNLFLFLLIAFFGLSATIIILLLVESCVKSHIIQKIKMLEELNIARSLSEMQMINREWKSVETSLDEDSSLDGSQIRRSTKPSKQILTKHSQSFKDMSRLRTDKYRKRNRKSSEAKG